MLCMLASSAPPFSITPTRYHHPHPPPPGVLPELAALLDLLQGTPEWGGDALGVAALIMAVLRRVADSYAAAGDPASATVVLESALRK